MATEPGTGSSSSSVLSDCCVFVWQRVDGDAYAHNALVAKARALGAKVATRLGKEVTHIIFPRKLQPTQQEQRAEEGDLRSLYSKAEPHMVLVSPLWLQHSADNGARALEVRYRVKKPPDPIFLVSSPNKSGGAGAKRKRKSIAARPREAVLAADLDDAIFSSSQQIQELDADDGRHVASFTGAAGAEAGAPSDVKEVEEEARPRKMTTVQLSFPVAKASTAAPRAAGGAGTKAAQAKQPSAPTGKPPLRQLTLSFTAAASKQAQIAPQRPATAPGGAPSAAPAVQQRPSACADGAVQMPPPPAVFAAAQRPSPKGANAPRTAHEPAALPTQCQADAAAPPRSTDPATEPGGAARPMLRPSPLRQCAAAAVQPDAQPAEQVAKTKGSAAPQSGQQRYPPLPCAPAVSERAAPDVQRAGHGGEADTGAVAAGAASARPPHSGAERSRPPAAEVPAARPAAGAPAPSVAPPQPKPTPTSVAAELLAALPAAGRTSGRRGSRSNAATPLGPGRGGRGWATPLGTPLGLTPGAITVPRIKSQGSSNPSRSSTPDALGAASQPEEAAAGPVARAGSEAAAGASVPPVSANARDAVGRSPGPHTRGASRRSFGFAAAATGQPRASPGQQPGAERSGPEHAAAAQAPSATATRARSRRETGLPPTPPPVLQPGATPPPSLAPLAGGAAASVTPRLWAGALGAGATGAPAAAAVDDIGAGGAGRRTSARKRSQATRSHVSPVGPSAAKRAAGGADAGVAEAAGDEVVPGSAVALRRSSRLGVVLYPPLALKPTAAAAAATALGEPAQRVVSASAAPVTGPSVQGGAPAAQPQVLLQAAQPSAPTSCSPARLPAPLQPPEAAAAPVQQQAHMERVAERHADGVGVGATGGTPATTSKRRRTQAALEEAATAQVPQLSPAMFTRSRMRAGPTPPPCTASTTHGAAGAHHGADVAASPPLSFDAPVCGAEADQEAAARITPAQPHAAADAAAEPAATAAPAAHLGHPPGGACVPLGGEGTPAPREALQEHTWQLGAQHEHGAAAAGTPPSASRQRPAASHVSGTPMTSPKYYTRFQRKRFSRIGVDLEGLPPGRPFVLQPDGSVALDAAEAGGTAAGPGVEEDAAAGAGGREAAAGAQSGTTPAARQDTAQAGCNGAGADATLTHGQAASVAAAGAATASRAATAPSPGGAVVGSARRSRRRVLEWDYAVTDAATAAGLAPRSLADGTAATAVPASLSAPSTAGGMHTAPAPAALPSELLPDVRGQPSRPVSGAARGPATARAPSALPAVAEEEDVAGADTEAAAACDEGTPAKQLAPSDAGLAAGAAGMASATRSARRRAAVQAHTPLRETQATAQPPAHATEPGAAGAARKKAGAVASAAAAVSAVTQPVDTAARALPHAAAPGASASGVAPPQARPGVSLFSSSRLSLRKHATAAAKPATAPQPQTAAASLQTEQEGPAAIPQPPPVGPPAPPVAPHSSSRKRCASPEGAGVRPAATPSRATAPPSIRKRAGVAAAAAVAPVVEACEGAPHEGEAVVHDADASVRAPAPGAQQQPSAGPHAAAASDQAALAAGIPRGCTLPVAPALGLYPRGKEHPLRAGVRYLAHSCVDAATAAAIQAAVRQLGGARLCTPGYEDGHVTHLVLGAADRRTVKVLVAIANGALLVTPAWVEASAAAGRWLPAEDFRVQGAFAATADAVRAQLQAQHAAAPVQPSVGGAAPPPGPSAPPCTGVLLARPLTGSLVAVHNPHCTGPRLAESQARKGDMEKVVVALGGRVVPVRSATLLLLVGAGGGGGTVQERRPRLGGACVPAVAVAGEEWLMRLAETHVWQEPAAPQ